MIKLICLMSLLIVTPADADEIPCAPVQPGTIQLDGLLGDWDGAKGVGVDQAAHVVRGKKEWSGPDDLSFDVYCNHDKKALYLAINVKDEYFIRSRQWKGDDHIEVLFRAKRLVVYPGDLRAVKARMTWGKRGKVKGITMVEALQTSGYSVELKIPFRRLPGYRHGQPSFPGAVWVADSDSKAQGRIQTVIGSARSARQGGFSFAQARVQVDGFLKDKGYTRRDIRSRMNANVVGGKDVEQVLLVGKTIGIVGKDLPGGAYFYFDLPVKSARDIYWLKLMDLNGDGKKELLTRVVERSANGRRELIAVFRFNDSNRFLRSFAHEILKGQKKRIIINRYSFKQRRRRRRLIGVDLVFDKPVARGYGKESYREVPSTDCFSILLPWGEQKRRRFRFEGDEFFEK